MQFQESVCKILADFFQVPDTYTYLDLFDGEKIVLVLVSVRRNLDIFILFILY
jgi:hypothetical protein